MYASFAHMLEKNSIPEPNSGCTLWFGRVGKGGYGCIRIKKRNVKVTHMVLEDAGLPRPPKAFACHTCDNPSCINPDHLYWGDIRTNTDDALARGRMGGVRKLTPEIVVAIRQAHMRGHSCQKIAKDLGVSSRGNVWRVIKGQIWSHVPMPLADGCSS